MKIQLHEPHFIHHIGQRDNQEDSLLPADNMATAETRLFLVCDGMGGHSGGEVASGTVCRAFDEYFSAKAVYTDIVDDSVLTGALAYAYTKLDAADDGAFKKMGTTLTLVCFHKGGVTMAHAGDSRIYHIRPGQAMPLYKSRDHSLVYDMYQAGEITYEEMKTDRRKNIITRALMPGEENRVELSIAHTTDVMPGDYFYLCSDGMLEVMEDDELVQIVSADMPDADKIQILLNRTIENKDNHTAYLLKVASVAAEEGDKALLHDEDTSRCNAMNIVPRNYDDISLVSGPAPEQAQAVAPPPTPAPEHKSEPSPAPAPSASISPRPGGRRVQNYVEAMPSQTLAVDHRKHEAASETASSNKSSALLGVVLGIMFMVAIGCIAYYFLSDKGSSNSSAEETTTVEPVRSTHSTGGTGVETPLNRTTPNIPNEVENAISRPNVQTNTTRSSSSTSSSTPSNTTQNSATTQPQQRQNPGNTTQPTRPSSSRSNVSSSNAGGKPVTSGSDKPTGTSTTPPQTQQQQQTSAPSNSPSTTSSSSSRPGAGSRDGNLDSNN